MNFGRDKYSPWASSCRKKNLAPHVTSDRVRPAQPTAYDAFGIIRAQKGSSSNYWLFTGEQRDSESGYDYLRARYYDSNVGRFLGQDPVAPDWQTPVTMNRYAYVLNNPWS